MLERDADLRGTRVTRFYVRVLPGVLAEPFGVISSVRLPLSFHFFGKLSAGQCWPVVA